MNTPSSNPTPARGPRWGTLYLLAPLGGGLFWLESRARFSPNGHMAAQIAIIVLICGLAQAWHLANRNALLQAGRGETLVDGRPLREMVSLYTPELPQDSALVPAAWPMVEVSELAISIEAARE